MHKQIQIAPGVYVTDFRKDQPHILGLAQQILNQVDYFRQKSELTNDVNLLLDSVNALESKMIQLEYSNQEIMKEDKWSEDPDFVEAVDENWGCIARFSAEMKQKVLRLFQLNYHPETEKLEKLLNISRIEARQQKAQQNVKKVIQANLIKLQEQKCNQKKENSQESQEQDNNRQPILVTQNLQKATNNKSKGNDDKDQTNKQQDDGSVYV